MDKLLEVYHLLRQTRENKQTNKTENVNTE